MSLGAPCLRAEDAPSPILPSGKPIVTLALSNGLKYNNISIAVSKALAAETWENLGWEDAVTTGTTKQSHVNIKIFVLASASDVKFYAKYTPETKITDEKCQQIVLGKIRELERIIADELNLNFRKAKGSEAVDQATTD